MRYRQYLRIASPPYGEKERSSFDNRIESAIQTYKEMIDYRLDLISKLENEIKEYENEIRELRPEIMREVG